MSLRCAVLILLLGALLPHAAAADGRVARFAIVLGNNAPESEQTQALQYADDDAVATHQLLIEAGVDSVLLVQLDRDSQLLHPQLVPYAAPRQEDLERAFDELFERIREATSRGAATDLLVFYSGHGDVEGGEGYVVLADGRLTRSMLYALLTRSPATRNHVFVDACKSYFLAFEKGPGGQRSPYVQAFASAQVPARLANTGFVLSTSSDRDSHEWGRYQGGILTHELRSALRGAADVDESGGVTYAEIGAFLTVANQNILNPRFRPDFMVRPPADDLQQEVLHWQRDVSTLRLEGAALGHLYLETPRGERVLDVHPDARTPLLLHVPAERPLFLRSSDETTEAAITSLAPLRVSSLSPMSSEVGRRGALHLAFEQLFAAPFGPESVASFELSKPSLELAASPSRHADADTRRMGRTTVGALALAAAASGLSLSIAAWQKYESGSGASQVEIAQRNQTVRRLNIASVVCYALSGAAGAAWAWMVWGPHPTVGVEPLAAEGHGRRLMVGLETSF